MKKKSERKLKKEEIRKKLAEAIEIRLQKLKEYRATPTRDHLNKVVEKLDLADNSAVLIVSFNPETKNMQFYGIKCKTSDLVAMSQYAYAKTMENDLAGVMDCISTVTMQEELNDCWVKNNETETELKDE